MRTVSIAICTSGDPVSPSFVPYSLMILALVAWSSAIIRLTCRWFPVSHPRRRAGTRDPPVTRRTKASTRGGWHPRRITAKTHPRPLLPPTAPHRAPHVLPVDQGQTIRFGARFAPIIPLINAGGVGSGWGGAGQGRAAR